MGLLESPGEEGPLSALRILQIMNLLRLSACFAVIAAGRPTEDGQALFVGWAKPDGVGGTILKGNLDNDLTRLNL
ncbi:MAG: hypothetical protein IAE94_02575 [Chthoniobacterales bacterium]|nr:hypothetical protein [Chthoniobacterales bacterium]